MGVREYDPALGRFNSPDPVYRGKPQLPLDRNKYIYAVNNPANKVDLNGLYYVDLNVTVGLGLGGTFGIQIDSEGISPYVGYGVMSSSSASVTASPNDISPGWNTGFQFSGGEGAGQAGVDSNGDLFSEIGTGVGGTSATRFYVCNKLPWSWKKRDIELHIEDAIREQIRESGISSDPYVEVDIEGDCMMIMIESDTSCEVIVLSNQGD
jgi:hypothetical protein